MVALAIDPQLPIRSAPAVTIDGLDRRIRLTAFSDDQLSADLGVMPRHVVRSGAASRRRNGV